MENMFLLQSPGFHLGNETSGLSGPLPTGEFLWPRDCNPQSEHSEDLQI